MPVRGGSCRVRSSTGRIRAGRGRLGTRFTARRPARVADLAARISGALGRPVNPDSPAQVLRALAANGVRVSSTRSGVLRGVDHPAAPLLLEYKELARLHAAHGWAWLDEWVADGRFRAEYVVGGVVSGRWATRGGGSFEGRVVDKPGFGKAVVGRGAVNQKGPEATFLAAMHAIRGAGKKMPVNFVFVAEGEEESRANDRSDQRICRAEDHHGEELAGVITDLINVRWATGFTGKDWAGFFGGPRGGGWWPGGIMLSHWTGLGSSPVRSSSKNSDALENFAEKSAATSVPTS